MNIRNINTIYQGSSGITAIYQGDVLVWPFQPLNEIRYTTINGDIIIPKTGWTENIVSNTYENGLGIIRFDAPVTQVPYGALGTYINVNPDTGLTFVSLPDSITTIANGAFTSQIYLQEVHLPSGLTSLYSAFQRNLALSSITIPSCVTFIGKFCFSSCPSLSEINAYPATAPVLEGDGTAVFMGVSETGVLHHPSGSDYSTWLISLPSGWTSVDDL